MSYKMSNMWCWVAVGRREHLLALDERSPLAGVAIRRKV